MYYTKQDDYDLFVCQAGKCPKTCCEKWLIEIDDDSLNKYKNEQGSFKSRLQKGIDWDYGTFKLNGIRCSMLNKDNLCDLQLCMGEESLCYTCRMYPRHVEEYDGIRELILSLSCPEVARMVINREEKYEFIETEDDLPETYDDFEDFDFLLHSSLEYTRKKLYEILSDRSTNIWCRLANILALCKSLQECIEDDNIFEIEEKVDDYTFDDKIDTKYWLNVPMDILSSLEALEESWFSYVEDINKFYKGCDFGKLTNAVTFKEEISLENIATLLIFSFFCGAVYDDELYSKAALCMISSFWIYVAYRKDSPNENLKSLEESLYTYASEIEHSDKNLIALEKYLKSIHFNQ